MKSDDFEHILRGAINGNNRDLEKIFEMYAPMIHKYACIRGVYNEDLNQQLLFHIALNIHKFKI